MDVNGDGVRSALNGDGEGVEQFSGGVVQVLGSRGLALGGGGLIAAGDLCGVLGAAASVTLRACQTRTYCTTSTVMMTTTGMTMTASSVENPSSRQPCRGCA